MSEIKQYFMNDMSTQLQREALMKSEAWQIVVAAINTSPGEVLVGPITMSSGNTHPVDVTFVTPSGFNIAMLSMGKRFEIYLANDPTLEVRGWSADMKSTRAAYIASKLRKRPDKNGTEAEQHGLYNMFVSHIYKAKKAPNSIVKEAIEKAFNRLFKGQTDHSLEIDMNRECSTALARIYMGDMNRNEMPSHMVSALTQAFKKYTDLRDNLNESLQSLRDFFSCNKWIVIFNNEAEKPETKPMWIGGVGNQPALAALNEYVKESRLPEQSAFSYAEVIEPFKWYKSYEDVPEELRSQLDVELMMYKVHRGRDSLLPNRTEFDHRTMLWQEGGAVCWYNFGEKSVLVMDKR